MGRLTLNVLLSFAQFEREVIGERIRDKIAASKKKGMWMGGVPPLGYRAQDGKLIIVESEAQTVRFIFRRYAELGSVRLLKDELDARSIQSKLRTSASGRLRGGKPFARGALYLMLQNRIYRGEIVHKEQSHPGEHTPIIDQPLWDAVQAQLAGNAAERNSSARHRQPSLLAGLLFDGDGNRMTPSHAVKKGTRYRYYVSGSLITKDRTENAAALRIPAAEIEQLVSDRVHRWLLDPGSIDKSTAARLADPSIQHRRVARAAEIGKHWPELPVARKRAVLTTLIERIDVRVDRIDIRLRPPRLAALSMVLIHHRKAPTTRKPSFCPTGTAAPRRAGDQNGDRRHRSVCHRETECAIGKAASQGAPVQRGTHPRRRHRLCCTRPAGRC
jgi:Site-specific recombinases, DNA invertase Pin homologs